MKWTPLYRINPKYPALQRSGYVVLNFTVNESGQVTNIKVVESTRSIFEKKRH
jgi:TonB family protein